MQTRTVLVEKTFNFKVQCYCFFYLKKARMSPFFPPMYTEFQKYWERVYQNGHSGSIDKQIKELKQLS